MRHLLIDYDSTIPNLALMRISAWAKAKGDAVYLNEMDDITCVELRYEKYDKNNRYRQWGYDAHEELSCVDAGYCHV